MLPLLYLNSCSRHRVTVQWDGLRLEHQLCRPHDCGLGRLRPCKWLFQELQGKGDAPVTTGPSAGIARGGEPHHLDCQQRSPLGLIRPTQGLLEVGLSGAPPLRGCAPSHQLEQSFDVVSQLSDALGH